MTAWRVAAAGMVALAVAMGIGRFAFTPLLPMMLSDGVVQLAQASWLASANYLGYLVGALLCTFQPWIWRRLGLTNAPHAPTLVRAGLLATVLLTMGMGLPWSAAWPLLRFAAGVASAVVFIYTSLWCLAQLARLNLPTMGALIYVGPGLGIVVSGVAASAMVALHWSAAAGWFSFGLLAALLTVLVWPTLGSSPSGTSAAAGAAAGVATDAPHVLDAEMLLFTLAYGMAGFGYIISATFLPVIARQALPGSPWLDLFWPILGLGVIAGALLASRIRVHDLRAWLIVCYLVQAAGVCASLVSPTLAGFALGSLLIGLPFTAIVFYAMQEVRRLRGAQASSFMGLVTALYGLGQIVGPPLATALLPAGGGGQGFNVSLQIAAAALVFGALLYALLMRLYPLPR